MVLEGGGEGGEEEGFRMNGKGMVEIEGGEFVLGGFVMNSGEEGGDVIRFVGGDERDRLGGRVMGFGGGDEVIGVMWEG